MKLSKSTYIAILFGLLFGALVAYWQTVWSFTKDITNSYSFADATAMAAPSVVSIFTSTIKTVNPRSNNPLIERFFKNQPRRQSTQQEISLGSGIIIHKNGYIVTNLHVIRDASEILVQLYDGRQTNAKVVGKDEETDLAVLKIKLTQLDPVLIGNSQIMRVGDAVLAIGNPFGFGQTVTSGIISAKGRYGLNLNTYENYIQTDAAVNIGSSGGALINARGELIGMNTANYTQSGGSLGIALATPVETISKVLTDIIQYGYVIRGWLGLEVTQLTPALAQLLSINRDHGVVITHTHSEGPAEKAGLKINDVILSIDGIDINTGHQGLLEVAELSPGKQISIEVLRNNQKQTIMAEIGIRPVLSARQ